MPLRLDDLRQRIQSVDVDAQPTVRDQWRHARKPGDAGAKEFATTTDTLGKNKLWAALPFVANQRLIPYEMEMTYGSPSAQMAFLDVVEKAFTS